MPSSSSAPLPDVTANAEPVIVLDDDTPPENPLEPPENEESAWDEPVHPHGAHGSANSIESQSLPSSAFAVSSVASIEVVHAPLLSVKTASCAALLLNATVSTTTASSSSRVSAIAPFSTAVASSSRARTRSPFSESARFGVEGPYFSDSPARVVAGTSCIFTRHFATAAARVDLCKCVTRIRRPSAAANTTRELLCPFGDEDQSEGTRSRDCLLRDALQSVQLRWPLLQACAPYRRARPERHTRRLARAGRGPNTHHAR